MLIRFFTLLTVLFLGFTSPSFAAEPAPDFTLPTLPDGSKVNLADFKGRVVYLDFWATWCAPCRKSFPWMDEMQERYNDDGLTIIAVSIDKKRKLIEQFIQQTEPNFIVAHDPTGKVAKDYKLRGMPSTYLIDREGQLVMTHLGFRPTDKAILEEAIQSQLDK